MTAAGRRRAARLKSALAPVDYGLQVARFCYFYPGMPYISGEWPTADHIIPWALFQLLYRRLNSVMALARLNAGRAAATSELLARGELPHADMDEAFLDVERVDA